MKIFVSQIKAIAGDTKGNLMRIENSYKKAMETHCDICLLPELVTSGYLAEDLFFDPDFIAEITDINNKLVQNSKKCALVLSTIVTDEVDYSSPRKQKTVNNEQATSNDLKNITLNNSEKNLYNGVIVAQNGKIIGQTLKATLPNNYIFDEKRYFTPGISNIVIINGIKVGIPICEDIWYNKVCKDLKTQGAEIFLVPNASPFEIDKFAKRTNQVALRYKENNIPFIYCNQACSQDGIIFDGNSFCYDGKLSIICDKFCEDNAVIFYENNRFVVKKEYPNSLNILEDIYEATKFGLKSYIEDNGFKKVIIGLSGGIDSAIVACICVSAIGSENVSAYMLPSKITSESSINDAKELAKLLNIKLTEIPITTIVQQYTNILNYSENEELEDLTYQNLQARIRGTILMAESNKTGALLITTGNKSEYATGYATIYGDMNGAFNPIKDIYKTQVFALAKYINSILKVIPENIINKAPSAELATNQKDIDSLPNYELLDKILYSYIELNLATKELYEIFEPTIVNRVIKLVQNSEFKRKQSAPGIKISTKNLEKDRRFPITNLFQH